MLDPGTVLNNRYRVEALVDSGGFSRVYKVQDLLLAQEVAIKEYVPSAVHDEDLLRRFLFAARASIRLAHDQIVRAYHLFPETDTYYIVMEYMAGGSLESLLYVEGALPVAEAAGIAVDVCKALSYAHGRGVVYNDLKPSSILFTDRGQPKLAPIDVARVSKDVLKRSWSTEPGFVVGTLSYMAPEQVDGVRDETRADLYSLGAVLYRMLTGRSYLPFDPSSTPSAQVDNVLLIRNEMPLPPSAHRPSLPQWLDEVVLKALAKDPEQRPATASELWAALEEGLHASDLQRAPSTPPLEVEESLPTPSQLGAGMAGLRSSSQALQPGDTLLRGQYRIVAEVGEGGFGLVYRAEDTHLRGDVAVKEMVPARSVDGLQPERLLGEAKGTMLLTHENIVRTHHAFAEEGRDYVVMEYMAGGSLDDRLEQENPLPVSEAVRIILDVCEGVQYAHRRGVVHCDLKPANILFTGSGGQAKVADFGIAHYSEDLLERSWHTPAGFSVGTLPYMSPEQVDGVRDDPRVDVYALGALLYRMLAGHTYLDLDPSKTPGAQADNVLRVRNELPPPPSQHNPSVPGWLDAVVLKALAKKVQERYADAGELQRALRNQEVGVAPDVMEAAPTPWTPISPPGPTWPQPDAQAPDIPGQAVPSVDIRVLTTGGPARVGQEVLLEAQAQDTEDIVYLALIVDGQRAAEVTCPDPAGAPSLSARQRWTFDSPGRHVISAMARTAAGELSELSLAEVAVVAASEA